MTVVDPSRRRPAPATSSSRSPARRRADILAEVAATDPVARHVGTIAPTPPRPIVDRLARPGLHLIAEIKRSSPSAGRIAADGEDIVARARAYEAGGASAISVLCEPHWFGGSVDDLRAVRAAVAVPVLAKDFVVEDVQLPLLRAAGADLVLLLAVLHPASGWRVSWSEPSSSASSRSSRSTTRASSSRALAIERAAHRAQQSRPADARRRRRACRAAA